MSNTDSRFQLDPKDALDVGSSLQKVAQSLDASMFSLREALALFSFFDDLMHQLMRVHKIDMREMHTWADSFAAEFGGFPEDEAERKSED